MALTDCFTYRFDASAHFTNSSVQCVERCSGKVQRNDEVQHQPSRSPDSVREGDRRDDPTPSALGGAREVREPAKTASEQDPNVSIEIGKASARRTRFDRLIYSADG